MLMKPINIESLLGLFYIIWQKGDFAGWSWLQQVIPLKAEHFPWVVTEEETSETCSCWPGRKQTAVLWTANPQRWPPAADGSPADSKRENRDLSLTTSKSGIWSITWMRSKGRSSPRASRKECILADPEQRAQPCCVCSDVWPTGLCAHKWVLLWADKFVANCYTATEN